MNPSLKKLMKNIKGKKDSVCNDCFDDGFKGSPCPHIEVAPQDNWEEELSKIFRSFLKENSSCTPFYDGYKKARLLVQTILLSQKEENENESFKKGYKEGFKAGLEKIG